MRNYEKIARRTLVILFLFVYFITVLFKGEIFAVPPGDKIKVDMKVYYSSGLKNEGVTDLSYDNLIKILQTTENFGIKFYTILLFGERELKESIPFIAPFLNDTDTNIRIAAAEALGKLGDLRGIPVLEKICEEKPDDLKCSDATRVLAENGDLNAYKYIKNFTKSKNWGYRSGALYHMQILAEKIEPTNPDQSKAILDDMITVLSEDEDANVIKGAISFLSGIRVKNRKHVIERLRELKAKFNNKGIDNEISDYMDLAIESLELKEKQKSIENQK